MTDYAPTYRPELQGLRAIAVVLVVLAHAGAAIAPGGFIGVDVFFVLSGYLITALLLGELEQTGRISFLRFYGRRLRRLLPALLFVLAISSVLALWLLSAAEARRQLASAPFAATWTSNLYFSFVKLDYFDELANRDLMLHTWSLGVEEQFYLLWPALLVALSGLGKRLKRAGGKKTDVMLAGIAVTFALSLGLCVYWTAASPRAAFYLMPSRIWQLSLGALVYLVFRSDPRQAGGARGRAWPFAPLFLGAGLVLIIGSAVGLHSKLAYPGLWALVPSAGAALILAAGHVFPRAKGGPLAHPALVWIGDRSYSWYLWHWPILMLGFSLGFGGRALPALGLVLLSLLCAAATFRLVELPFWKGRWSRVAPVRACLFSILAMSIAVLGSLHGPSGLPAPAGTADMSQRWRADIPRIYGMGCDAWHAHARVEPCVFGAQAAEKTVVLLGDSVVAQWFSMIPAIFAEPRWRTVVLTKSACAMIDHDYYYVRIGKIYQVCTDWRNAALDQLQVIRPDVLIMGSAATYDFTDTQWVEGSSRIFARASKAARQVFVIPGTPMLGFDGPGCVSRHLSANGRLAPGACSAADRLKQTGPVTRLLESTAARFPNVRVLDLNDLVCPRGTCSAVNEKGMAVFRDSQHLTDSFVRAQAPAVRERLKRVMGDSGL